MTNRYTVLYAINIDSDFWYIKENSTPEDKELNSVFLKALLMPPEWATMKVQMNFSLISYYNLYFGN